jgi:hypothetical protein
MPQLNNLPTEILWTIADYLGKSRYINSLARTDRHLYNALDAFLYQYNAEHEYMSGLLSAARRGKLRAVQRLLVVPGFRTKSTYYATRSQ